MRAQYDAARGARLDYAKPLDPPLAPEQLAWLQDRLRERDEPGEPKPTRPRKGRRR